MACGTYVIVLPAEALEQARGGDGGWQAIEVHAGDLVEDPAQALLVQAAQVRRLGGQPGEQGTGGRGGANGRVRRMTEGGVQWFALAAWWSRL